MLLSIIIPAYNADKYIKNCLRSLSTQDILSSDYEIIVVNDGSSDKTEHIVSHEALTSPNILLVNQENKGNGGARNTGIDLATGKYLYFLDADDYIAENTLGTLLQLLEKNNLEILGFSTIAVKDSSLKVSKNLKNFDIDLNIKNGLSFIGSHNYEAEIWWYIIKKDFFDKSGIRFFDRKFVQDSYITPTLFSKAKRISYVGLDVHRYRKSANSITKNTSHKHLLQHFEDLAFSIEQLYDLKNKLEKKANSNQNALKRLHVKQQRYVFITIVRFIKSSLDLETLKAMLLKFNTLGAYPMDKFMSLPDYKSTTYALLTYVFNRKYLLFPAISIYRKIKN